MKNKDDFKVVGYYPNWQPDKTHTIQYQHLTHIIYCFAIPKPDGTLHPLENPDTAIEITQKAHKQGVKVLLTVGGWSYKDIPLEPTFLEATNTAEKIEKLSNAIVSMAKKYGFDGVDVDWEHPRTKDNSKKQYESLMLNLSEKLKKENMLLTAAVLSGVNADGTIHPDSQAHSDAVLNAIDWVNVMAYDGGDGPDHSSYEFAINSANYWKNNRRMPADKVVLGLPFYGRPSWVIYRDLLKENPEAYTTDILTANNKEVHYNGIPTIEKKTQWACENLGGVMIWELSQDSASPDTSLLNAMAKVIAGFYSSPN